MSIRALLIVVTLAGGSGCMGGLHKVDGPFPGLRQEMTQSANHGELHVMQMHGMGDHRAEEYCADDGKNIGLQRVIANRLGLSKVDGVSDPRPLRVGEIEIGSYSTHVYASLDRTTTLYFSCMAWGDAGRRLKRAFLDLESNFRESSDLEDHRALINSAAKRFVNRSLSDPVLYSGQFGALIREAIWSGVAGIEKELSIKRSRLLKASNMEWEGRDASPLNSNVPMVVISDSLGSKVILDTICAYDEGCAKKTDIQDERKAPAGLVNGVRSNVVSIFMLANQLPLLQLADVNPPRDKALEEWLESGEVACPFPSPASWKVRGRESDLRIVAFTDVNDVLSYRLSERFKQRCAGPNSGISIVNVLVPNARAWFGLYASMGKAHASGFKGNSRAIDYLVDGYPLRGPKNASNSGDQ
ncbi:MAG: hypothetical protein EOP90_13700 [Lysobacteraceae bacterium]|nr:MAG: hypothetical protein EOP90_13700 [Xanthomonadaceae bacterium]